LLHIQPENAAGVFHQRLVEVHHIDQQGLQVNRRKALATGSAFHFGNLQKLLEHHTEFSDFFGHQRQRGGLHFGAGLLRVAQAQQYARQRRSEVVRNAVGDMAYAFHQLLEPIEHGVDIAVEQREFITALIDRNALAQIARRNARHGVANGGRALIHHTPEDHGTYQGHDAGRDGRQQAGLTEQLLHVALQLHVAAYGQQIAIGHFDHGNPAHHQPPVALHGQLAHAHDAELARRIDLGIADNGLALRVHENEDFRVGIHTVTNGLQNLAFQRSGPYLAECSVSLRTWFSACLSSLTRTTPTVWT
jgi:hypothetical protein